MLNKIIDLYSYFKIDRNGADKGFLSLYVLSDALEKQRLRPAMLIIGGGGYRYVSKREQEPIAIAYLKEGFNCFSLEYSCCIKFPVAFREAAMAMAYLAINANELNIDANKIFGVGFSAGAHLLGCISYLFDNDCLKESLSDVEYFSNHSIEKTIKPKSIIMCYPVITSSDKKLHEGSFNNLCGDDKKLVESLSLENRITENAPPAFIWHTYYDDSVPVYNSIALALAYENVKVPFSLNIYEFGKHGLSLANAEVYNKNEIPNHSSEIDRWLKLSVLWLKERSDI